MIATFTIALTLLGLSGLLIDSHRRSWQAVQQREDLGDGERRFARSQFRRRMQASGVIGLVGVAMGLGPLVPRQPAALFFYLMVLVVCCVWLVLLALLDMWSTQQHYRRVRGEQMAAQIRLAMELRRARGEAAESDA